MSRSIAKLCLNYSFKIHNVLCSPENYLKTNFRSSQYGAHFVEPVFTKPDLAKLKESGEAKKLAHIPIKAAKAEQTCSDYYDPLVEKFINYVMRQGRKEMARTLVNKSLESVKRLQVQKYNKETDPEEKKKIEINALKIFHDAIKNSKPILHLTPIKRGGATYQKSVEEYLKPGKSNLIMYGDHVGLNFVKCKNVELLACSVPVPISENKAQFLAMNWLIEQGKAEPKTERFPIKLARELIQASMGQGKVIKKKEELHKQCEANRAYAHYRWG